MWTAGIDTATGQAGQDQRLSFNSNFQALRSALFTQGNYGSALGALTRRWDLMQNGVHTLVTATAQAELAGAMTPAMAGRTRADFAVDFNLADPFFYGAQEAYTLPYNTVFGINNLGDSVVGFGQPSGLGGVPFTVRLTGPLTNPTLTNSTTGVSVTVSYTITAGRYCTLDIPNYTAYDDLGGNHLGVVSHAGARPWMILAEGNNSLKLTSTNVADSGSATVTYRPGYL